MPAKVFSDMTVTCAWGVLEGVPMHLEGAPRGFGCAPAKVGFAWFWELGGGLGRACKTEPGHGSSLPEQLSSLTFLSSLYSLLLSSSGVFPGSVSLLSPPILYIFWLFRHPHYNSTNVYAFSVLHSLI